MRSWVTGRWRKLYLIEPNEQLLWPILTRGLRDYLIRRASDDGVLFPFTADPAADVCQALGARDTERDTVRTALEIMLDDGFLVHRTDRALVIRNLAEAQTRRSHEAVRKAAQRDRKKRRHTNGTNGGTPGGTVPGTSPDASRDKPADREIERSEREEEAETRAHGGTNGTAPPGPEPAKDPDSNPALAAIRAELERWPQCRALPLPEIAAMLEQRFRTLEIAKGTKLAWFVTALGEGAADGVGQHGEALTRKLRAYGDRARAPRDDGNGSSPSGEPKSYESPKFTAAEIAEQGERARKAAAERGAKFAASQAKKGNDHA